MEVRPKAVICPVCLLFLREGISLRSHLQTHSKEKVIEALLYKQSEPASIEKETLTSAIRNASKISNSGNKVAQYNRGAVSILPSTSYASTNNLNQTICNPTISTVNNIQYVPTLNNNVFPQAVGNSYSNVTYQQFLTNEGNIVLIPVYMPQPSVVVGNMVPPSFINSCVVVPPANNTNPVNIVEQRSRKPENVETSTEVPITEENSHSTEKNDKPMEEDDEKENDAEVASIFKISNSNDNENSSSPQSPEKMNLEDGKLSSMSYENLDISDYENYSESSPSEFQNESDVQKSAISPGLSSIRVRNDLNYESDCSFHDDVNTSRANSVKCDESDHNKPSKLEDFGECSTNTLRNVTADKSERFDFIVSNSDNATHILPDNLEEYQNSKVEKDHYILPNDIPRNSPCSDLNFIGIRSSFLTSASLISSANKTMFADMDMYEVGNDDQNYFNKFNNQSADAVEKDDTTIIPKRFINDVEDKRKDIIESAGNSRISPFNIQTDESMPARGELSGQESLSGTENSIWELQVQQNTCVQRCNISCKKESSDVKVGLQSLMTEISIKLDTETFKQADDEEDVVEEDNKIVMQKLFKKKVIREYRCFYCKERFTTWKLRQIHINNVHSDEDGLTVETLFSKKIKFKQEDDTDPTPVENVICRICSVTFENSLEFLKHLKNMHGIKKRSCVCPTCLVHFPSVQEYEEHIQNVHPYECMNCGKKFHTRSGYMLHQKRHMKVKPYGCEVCDKSFVTKQKLSEHMNIHTGDNPIKCNLCNSNFKRYSNYQQHKKYLHMNTKRKLKDFICDCGEVFHSKVKLLWHQEIHDEKPKQCPFCVERFVHTASLTRHVRKWHNETYMSELVDKKKIRNVTCPVCNVTYLHTSLQTHMKIHEGIKPFSCSECSKTFRTKWNLQLHRWTHMSRSSKPFKCKICVKAYIHKTDYEAHLRSHSNCRPYSCNVCGRQFIRKYNCIRHMREHKEPRMFRCNICDKMFSRSYYLTEHRKTHTGEKPHTCHICGKSSATKSNHNKHVKMHNNIRESVNSEG